jgi:hypothetical protein
MSDAASLTVQPAEVIGTTSLGQARLRHRMRLTLAAGKTFGRGATARVASLSLSSSSVASFARDPE